MKNIKNKKLKVVLLLAVAVSLILRSFLDWEFMPVQTNSISIIKRKYDRLSGGGENERYELYVDNVVLTGKFNFATDLQYVYHWVTRWRKMFKHVIVYGPFSEKDIVVLDKLGVQAFPGADDAGWFSQMTCMATTLRHFANDTSIVGAIVSHDDYIFNLTHLHSLGFPSNDIIVPLYHSGILDKPLFEFTKNYTMRRYKDKKFISTNDYRTILPDQWTWWGQVVPTFAVAVAEDSRADQFAMKNKNFVLYNRSPTDFTYMPMKYAEQFGAMADVLVDNYVFLEIAIPTILGFLRHKYKATVRFVDHCEGPFNADRNDYFNWTRGCFSRGAYVGYHPVKMGYKGLGMWDTYFRAINPPMNDTKQ